MRLTDKQLIEIHRTTSFLYEINALWDSLTPKQRQRAEMLVERQADDEFTWPKVNGELDNA